MRDILTHEEIIQNIDEYINNHSTMVAKYKKFRKFYENKVGEHYSNRIVKNLRLQDEVRRWLEASGDIKIPHIDQNGSCRYISSDLSIRDIIVESTLPKSAINTLKTYSVGVKPEIDVGDTEQEWVKEFEVRENIHNKEKKIIQEMLSVGNAFFKVEKNNEKSDVILIPAEYVIVIPDTYNETEAGAYVYYCKKTNPITKKEYNYVEIYQLDGKVFKYNNSLLKNEVEEIVTGLKECSMHHVKGLEDDKDNQLYGASILDGLETTILEIVIRLTSNSYLFNKVNNPSIVTSEDFTDIDPETGEEVMQSGSMFRAGSYEGANSTRYIEPPTSHVSTIYEHIKINMQNAYSQLGVNEISLGLSQDGNIASGEAFKKAITPTLNKCRDITNNLRIPITYLYKQAYAIDNNGKDLSMDIIFNDGISLSDKENIENESLLVNNKILSRKTVLMKRGYTEEEAEEELKKIAVEEKMFTQIFDTVNEEDID